MFDIFPDLDFRAFLYKIEIRVYFVCGSERKGERDPCFFFFFLFYLFSLSLLKINL